MNRGRSLVERALRLTPGGAHTLSKRPDRYGAGMPAFLVRGEGGHVWDAEGRQYLDWIASLAAVTLGHAHPTVTEAMTRQLRDGGTFAMPHPLEVEVGERFLTATGWPDGMVRWVSSGSEATEAAVRTARIATGRDRLVSIGYHSWHSTFTAAKAPRPGVPDALALVIGDTPAGDLPLLTTRVDDSVAAVILEPCADAPPDAMYLQAVVDLAHRAGALVISDEIICGFRWHAHGAMLGTCGIRPDLATFGKAIANGAFPIAALVGSPAIMQHSWPVSGTANAHPVGLAGVAAVLDVYARAEPLRSLHAAGRDLRRGLAARVARCPGARARVGGDDPRPVIRIVADDPARANAGQTLLVQELARRGVLWHSAGAGNAMMGHEAYVEETLEAFSGALTVVAEALGTAHPETWLVGEPSRTLVAVR